jgi:riboflavin kinase
MLEIKLQHILTMTELLMLGAKYSFVELTTTDLGRNIMKSQQAASKHLQDLELAGYIDRVKSGQGFRVKLTDRGYAAVEGLFSKLKAAVESNPPGAVNFEGRVVSGMGEGAYYMSLSGYREQFQEKLGYQPYPGTLNVRLIDKVFRDARRRIGAYAAVFISGFSDSKRSYGWAKCYPAHINGGIIKDAAVIVLERTHYDEGTLELIAPVSIKEKAGIRNGDLVKIKLFVPPIPS